LTGSYYENGNLALPDQGTFIIEDTVFGDNVGLEANHHCQIGTTGVLCMPQYILHNVDWRNRNTESKWMWFQFEGPTAFGGIFTLSPESETQSEGSIFPPGFVSLVSSRYTYLLSAPDNACVLSSDLGYGTRYDNGILCTKPLRSLKIYSRGVVNAPFMLVQVWFNNVLGVESHDATPPSATQSIPFHWIGSGEKQGYSVPVIPGMDQSYKLSLETEDGAIPHDWVIEFSDPVVGNRWGPEYLQLELQGRSCGPNGLVSSQHDRRFLWSGFDFMGGNAWGYHGACVVLSDSPPDMPSVDCTNDAGQASGESD
jgi:hypothetical protein